MNDSAKEETEKVHYINSIKRQIQTEAAILCDTFMWSNADDDLGEYSNLRKLSKTIQSGECLNKVPVAELKKFYENNFKQYPEPGRKYADGSPCYDNLSYDQILDFYDNSMLHRMYHSIKNVTDRQCDKMMEDDFRRTVESIRPEDYYTGEFDPDDASCEAYCEDRDAAYTRYIARHYGPYGDLSPYREWFESALATDATLIPYTIQSLNADRKVRDGVQGKGTKEGNSK